MIPKKTNDVIIVSDGGLGSTLSIANTLKQYTNSKIYVLAAGAATYNLLKVSKNIDEVHQVNNIDHNTYFEDIERWYNGMNFVQKPVLYTTSDKNTFYIDIHREWFEERFNLCMPSSDIIRTFTKKGTAEPFAKEHGLTIPASRVIKNKKDIEFVANSFSFPVLLKPIATYIDSKANFKIKTFDTGEDFIETANEFINSEDYLLCQEYIPGGDDKAWFYLFYRNENGEIYECMGKKTLQDSNKGGIMAKGTTKFNQTISDISQTFLKNINYTGIGGIEYKEYNGVYYFIELSPRTEGFFKIADNSGIPLSLISFYDIIQSKEDLKRFSKGKQIEGIMYNDFPLVVKRRLKGHNIIGLLKDIYEMLFNKNAFTNMYYKNDKKLFSKVVLNKIKRVFVK